MGLPALGYTRASRHFSPAKIPYSLTAQVTLTLTLSVDTGLKNVQTFLLHPTDRSSLVTVRWFREKPKDVCVYRLLESGAVEEVKVIKYTCNHNNAILYHVMQYASQLRPRNENSPSAKTDPENTDVDSTCKIQEQELETGSGQEIHPGTSSASRALQRARSQAPEVQNGNHVTQTGSGLFQTGNSLPQSGNATSVDPDLMGVLCKDCVDIKLLDMSTGEVTVAFRGNEQCMVRCLRHGAPGRAWVACAQDPYPLLELDVSSVPYTRTGRVLHPGLPWSSGTCYLPPPLDAVVITDHLRQEMVALACSTGQKLWKVRFLLRCLLHSRRLNQT